MIRPFRAPILCASALIDVWFVGFLVPLDQIGDGQQHVGLSDQSWYGCFNCDSRGDCVVVPPGTDATDQLAPFRGHSLSQVLMEAHSDWSCSIVLGEAYTYGDDVFPSKETVGCNIEEPANFTIGLDCTGLRLSMLPPPSGIAKVVDVSYLKSDEMSCTGKINIVVMNIGNASELFQLKNGTCQLQPSTLDLNWAPQSDVVEIASNSSNLLSVPIATGCSIGSIGSCTYLLTWRRGIIPISIPFEFTAQSPPQAVPPPALAPHSIKQIMHFSVCFPGLDYSYFTSPVFDSSAFIER